MSGIKKWTGLCDLGTGVLICYSLLWLAEQGIEYQGYQSYNNQNSFLWAGAGEQPATERPA